MNAESAPKGALESATTTPSVTAGSLSLDDRLAAFEAGRQQGKAERIEIEVEDRARALLLAWSNESRDMAMRYASRVGPNWAAMVAGDLDER